MKNENTGDRSTGEYSTGDRSTGYRSTGNRSTGYSSTGDCSAGDYSTGDRSTGNWSTSKYSTGHFSTIDYSGFSSFNKPCTIEEWDNVQKPDFLYFELTEWIDDLNMTDIEKGKNHSYKVTGGYLKVYNYKESFKMSWDSASEEDKKLLFKLPNFDAEVFKDISGIDVNDSSNEMTIEQLEKLTGIKNLKIKK